jgi:hypothetical protein
VRLIGSYYGPCQVPKYESIIERHKFRSGRSENKEKTLEYLERANQKSARVSATEEAMVYFDEAMKLFDTLPDTEKNRQRRISLLVNQRFVFFHFLRFKSIGSC